MKKIWMLPVLFLAATAWGETNSVTFGHTEAAAGTRWTETASYSTEVLLSAVGGTSSPTSVQQSTLRTKECTIADISSNGRIESMLVLYTDVKVNGQPRSDVTGRVYSVREAGNDVEVTYATQPGAPSPEEVAFVAADNAHFRQFFAYEKLFGGKTFVRDVSVNANPMEAQELVNAADGVSLGPLALTLRTFDASTATFDISTSLSTITKKGKGKDAPEAYGGMTMTLEGTLQVAVSDCMALGLDLSGPVTIAHRKPDNKSVVSSGSGSATLSVTYSR